MTATTPTDRPVHPLLDAALRHAVAAGTVIVLLVPSARGVHAAIGWLPLWLVAMPLLQIVRIVKIAENSTDYSLMNTIRAALYLPTSREAKYKAKQAIDTFFVRLGDLLQAGIVFSGVSLGFGIRQFAIVNVCFVVAWLFSAAIIYREHKKISAEKVELPAVA